MQPAKITELPPVGVVYDANIGQNADSALALGLLHGFFGKQQCRIGTLTVNYPDLRAIQFCDAIETFYNSAANGGLFGVGGGLVVEQARSRQSVVLVRH